MQILFIGNFDGATFTTENHHKRTFERLGHTVITFQENNSSTAKVLGHIDKVDMLYWTHTHSFKFDNDFNIRKMLQAFKDKGIPSVGYHLDLFLGLEREKVLSKDPYWEIQYFFTVDRYMAEWLNANTNTKGFYLPPGCLEDEAYIANPNYIKYPHEVIFTGSKGYHAEWSYRPQLIDWLHFNYGNRFAHYGGGGKPTIREHELNTLYASAKIVVGDTLCKGFNYGYYFSDRLTEVTCRGGFLIFPYIKGLELMFELEREIVTYKFGDFDELRKKIDYYLYNDEEREAIRIAGHKRAKTTHTYTNRLTQLLETLEKEKATV